MRKPVRPRKPSITWHPLSWPAGHSLIADDPNEVYDEDKDNDEVCQLG